MLRAKNSGFKPEQVEFRSFQSEDQTQLWELHNLTVQVAGIHAGEGHWDNDLGRVTELYLEQQGEFLVGSWRNQIIAMGGLYKTGPARAEIKRMRVHPDFQGFGLGRILMDKLEKRAIQLGYQVLHLDTPVNQLPANKLYIHKGFQETHRGVIANLDTIFYEKRLADAD